MGTFVAALVVFAMVVLAMSVGAIAQGRRLRGSCGATGKECLCSPLAARSCRLRKERVAQRTEA